MFDAIEKSMDILTKQSKVFERSVNAKKAVEIWRKFKHAYLKDGGLPENIAKATNADAIEKFFKPFTDAYQKEFKELNSDSLTESLTNLTRCLDYNEMRRSIMSILMNEEEDGNVGDKSNDKAGEGKE